MNPSEPAKLLKLLMIGTLFSVVSHATTHAQIGSGWTQFFPTSKLDVQTNGSHKSYPVANLTVDGIKYTISNGVETFKIVNTSSTRIERRADEHYTSGKRQMQGDIKIHNVAAQTVHQIFHGSTGPYMLFEGFTSNGGELRKYGGHIVLISGISNVNVRYNNLHWVGQAMSIYINGTKKYSDGGANADGSGNDNKYGLYGSKTTSDPTSTWTNVKWYK